MTPRFLHGILLISVLNACILRVNALEISGNWEGLSRKRGSGTSY